MRTFGNNVGQSLTSVMVGTSVMAIMAVAFSSMMVNQQKQIRAINDKMSVAGLKAILVSALANGKICKYELNTPVALTFNSATNADIQSASIDVQQFHANDNATAPILARVNAPVVGSLAGLTVASIQLTNFQGNAGDTTLLANWVISFNSSQPLLPASIPVVLTVDRSVPALTKITDCAGSGPAAAGGAQFASFTARGASSWTAPAGVTSVLLEMWGGGGGGGDGGWSGCQFPARIQGGPGGGGGGGSGGQHVKKIITVAPNTTYALFVGGGGGRWGTLAQRDGQNSTFDSIVALGGGRGMIGGYGYMASSGDGSPAAGTTNFGAYSTAFPRFSNWGRGTGSGFVFAGNYVNYWTGAFGKDGGMGVPDGYGGHGGSGGGDGGGRGGRGGSPALAPAYQGHTGESATIYGSGGGGGGGGGMQVSGGLCSNAGPGSGGSGADGAVILSW